LTFLHLWETVSQMRLDEILYLFYLFLFLIGVFLGVLGLPLLLLMEGLLDLTLPLILWFLFSSAISFLSASTSLLS